MSERKTSKSHKRDRESTVSAVDIKSLTSSESTFYIRPLKVGHFKHSDIRVNDFIIAVSYFQDLAVPITLLRGLCIRLVSVVNSMLIVVVHRVFVNDDFMGKTENRHFTVHTRLYLEIIVACFKLSSPPPIP